MTRRSWTILIGLIAGLGAAGCGEITAFCLSAGAPDGVRLEVTTVPTPDGYRLQCHTGFVPDTLGRLQATGDSAATRGAPDPGGASLKQAERIP